MAEEQSRGGPAALSPNPGCHRPVIIEEVIFRGVIVAKHSWNNVCSHFSSPPPQNTPRPKLGEQPPA